MNLLIRSFLIATLCLASACAGKRELTKSKKYISLLQSTTTRTLPGRVEGEPVTDYSFTLVWKHQDQPVAFFWMKDGNWQICGIQEKGSNTVFTDVQKGDTLMVTPLRRVSEGMPWGIPEDLDQALVFRTAKSGWRYIKVQEFKQMPDIILQ